jgi:AraC family transcriptional regulator
MTQTKMKMSSTAQLEPPRMENGRALLIAGLREHYTSQTMNNIPAQWQRFAPHIGNVPGQVGRNAYGVCFELSESTSGIDYLSGVEVSGTTRLPTEFARVTIPAQKYAVFSHREHVSKLRNTLDAISREWRPEWGQVLSNRGAETPAFFERYTEEFDARSGVGGIEVWVPIRP